MTSDYSFGICKLFSIIYPFRVCDFLTVVFDLFNFHAISLVITFNPIVLEFPNYSWIHVSITIMIIGDATTETLT